MSFTVAIIGRPNVGKSTLFNRLIGKRLAMVDDTPGVTRDRRAGEGRIADRRFTAIDTAGLDEGPVQGADLVGLRLVPQLGRIAGEEPHLEQVRAGGAVGQQPAAFLQ